MNILLQFLYMFENKDTFLVVKNDKLSRMDFAICVFGIFRAALNISVFLILRIHQEVLYFMHWQMIVTMCTIKISFTLH